MRYQTIILLILLMGICLISCNPQPSNKTVDNIPIPSDDASTSPIPTHNWPEPVLTSELDLTASDLSQIGSHLGFELASGKNSYFEVDKSNVQLNEILPSNESDLVPLFHALFSMVGNVHSVLLGDDRIYEIITDAPYAAEAVRASLDLSPIQKVKLTPHLAYGELAVVQDEIVSGDQLTGISDRLGFEIDALVNQGVNIDGVRTRVNVILPASGITPLDAMSRLAYWKGSDAGIYVLNDVVIEVVTDNWNVAERIWRVINIPPPSISAIYVYKVRFTVAPLKSADYMLVNDMFQMACAGDDLQSFPEYDPELVFGNTLPLFLSDGRTKLESSEIISTVMIDDSIALGTIDTIPVESSTPSEIEIEITFEANRAYEKGPDEIIEYIKSTPFWPVDSDEVDAALAEARNNSETDSTVGLIHAISQWVGGNVVYGGENQGTRYGVGQAMSQGYGRCWDQSDVFITLARAAGLPTRQVAGWVYGFGGHVWSQVWIQELGVWIDVDPGLGQIGVSSLYIPIWGTRDGDMLFLYTSQPQIERMGN